MPSECCDPNPQCGAFGCSTDYLPRPQMSTLVCSSDTCDNDDCCYLAPECDDPAIICPGGTGYNKSGYANTHCTTDPCQELDCCDPVPDTCSTWDCAPMPGFLRVNPGSIICVGTPSTCDNTQCCEAEVQCSVNFNCDPGTHVIGDPTEHTCATATCQQSDCCEANAKCDDAIGMCLRLLLLSALRPYTFFYAAHTQTTQLPLRCCNCYRTLQADGAYVLRSPTIARAAIRLRVRVRRALQAIVVSTRRFASRTR
jgi:hypothetical protein